MKALSVCQPWAWAIVHGIKKVENRWRPTRHRGPLVIHASRSRRYLERDGVVVRKAGRKQLGEIARRAGRKQLGKIVQLRRRSA